MKSEEMILNEIEILRNNMRSKGYTTIDTLQASARIRGLLWTIDDQYPKTVALGGPDHAQQVIDATRLEKIEQVIDAVHKE